MLISERCKLVGEVVEAGSAAYAMFEASTGPAETRLAKVAAWWDRSAQFVRYTIRMWSCAKAGVFDTGFPDEPMTIEQAEIAAGVRDFNGTVRQAWRSVVPEEYGLIGPGDRRAA